MTAQLYLHRDRIRVTPVLSSSRKMLINVASHLNDGTAQTSYEFRQTAKFFVFF